MRKSQIPILPILLLVLTAMFIGLMARAVVFSSFTTANISNEMPKLHTNEQFVDDIRARHLDLNDIESVFSFVFSNINDSVNVYPTENYYYFSFYTEGREVSGNLRLDSIDREQGLISFAYFYRVNRKEGKHNLYRTSHHKNLGAEDGVIVKKIDKLKYTVSYGGKTVTFNLHDLPQTKPKNLKLHDGEVFVERTFDESGFQLVLIYDEKKPAFRFILDPEAPLPDILQPYAPNVLAGRLSGFVFFDEPGMDRKVLFGVDQRNISRNNFYDGPFDQLADNFLKGNSFREKVISVFPSLKGKISFRGDFLDENGKRKSKRVLLAPYRSYNYLSEIAKYAEKCQKLGIGPQVVACLTIDNKQNK
jgi:hypothetical protein